MLRNSFANSAAALDVRYVPRHTPCYVPDRATERHHRVGIGPVQCLDRHGPNDGAKGHRRCSSAAPQHVCCGAHTCWSVCAIRSSCDTITIPSSASIDTATSSNKTIVTCSVVKHSSTLQFQTGRSRRARLCVENFTEYAHMIFMYTQ